MKKKIIIEPIIKNGVFVLNIILNEDYIKEEVERRLSASPKKELKHR
jgi:hypothetical protein